MPILDVGDRLASPIGRLDLARELFGVVFHPHNKEARRQRQSAFGVTLLGMSDADDEPDARELAKTWFKKAGGFKTDAQADRYHKQQDRALEELLLRVFPTGLILHLIWAMNVHHREELIRGPSVHKAIAILRGSSCSPFEGVSKRTLQSAWSRYKSVAHICAVFALIFYSSDVDLAQKEEALKTCRRRGAAYDASSGGSLSAVRNQFHASRKSEATARPKSSLAPSGQRSGRAFRPVGTFA
jgi:hypothetical protein